MRLDHRSALIDTLRAFAQAAGEPETVPPPCLVYATRRAGEPAWHVLATLTSQIACVHLPRTGAGAP